MIIRKPYAFIIRHFKIINLVIAGCIAFLAVNATNLQQQFVDLKTSKMYTYAGAEYLINNNIFLFVIVGLILTGLVYYLLKEKKKPTRAYLSTIAYFIGTAVLILYLKNVCNNLVNGTVTESTLSLARDASMMIRYVGFILFCIIFVRGIGFNLGQFNFSKDIREMKIVEEDSAEFEVMIGQNNYKYARGFRRFVRECKYYFLENLVYFELIGGLMIIACSIYGLYYYKTYLDRAKEEAIMTVDGINYSVNGAYITAEDYNGNIVKENSKFVVVNLSLTNTLLADATLDLTKISIQSGKIEFYPTLYYNGKFYDLGVPYQEKQQLISGETTDVTLTFEVPATTNVRNWTLRIQEAVDNNGLKVLVMYRKFKITTKDIDSEDKDTVFTVGQDIKTNTVNHNMFKMNIQSFSFEEKYLIDYALCNSKLNCSRKSKLISPSMDSTDSMITLNLQYTLYDDAYFTKTFPTINDIFSNYATIIYTIGTKEYQEKGRLVTQENVDNYVFLRANRRVKDASNVMLKFDFRNQKYYLRLN